MELYSLDPLVDSRWEDLVASHPQASAFHQPGWLKSLAQTYGYRTIALTSSRPGEQLSDGFVFCEVRSWITGSRLVSLPFTDHTELLLNERSDLLQFVDWIRKACHEHGWRYIELRPLSEGLFAAQRLINSQSFWIHSLDLTLPVEQLFRRLHRSCLQRRIRHAERQQLSYVKSSSDELLDDFYDLLMMTRRRYRLLPQPRIWFRNLMNCMGENAEIRMVRKDQKALAAVLTLRHGGTVVYKYGCSDDAFHHLGGMPLLFWRLIEESKAAGADVIDFGRTDMDNPGLIRFKDRFGTTRRQLNYLRYTERESERATAHPELLGARALCSALPDALSATAGHLVYRHIG